MITDTNNKFIIPFQYTHEEMKNDTVTEETRTVLFKACIRNLLLYKSITGGKDLFNALDEYKKVFEKVLKNGKAFDVIALANKPESEIISAFNENAGNISEVYAMLSNTEIDEHSELAFSDLLYKVMYISAQPQEKHNELIAMPIEQMFDFEVLSDASLFMQLISTQLYFADQYRGYIKKKTLKR